MATGGEHRPTPRRCVFDARAASSPPAPALSAVNWKLFGFTLFTWALTVPFCAVLSGVLYAVIAYSPQASCDAITIAAVRLARCIERARTAVPLPNFSPTHSSPARARPSPQQVKGLNASIVINGRTTWVNTTSGTLRYFPTNC